MKDDWTAILLTVGGVVVGGGVAYAIFRAVTESQAAPAAPAPAAPATPSTPAAKPSAPKSGAKADERKAAEASLDAARKDLLRQLAGIDGQIAAAQGGAAADGVLVELDAARKQVLAQLQQVERQLAEVRGG